MDVDVDFDFDEDKIKTFLKNKLSEIKAKNEELEQKLEDRRHISKDIIKNSNVQREESNIEISAEVWKIFNGKYVIGATLVNKTSSRCLCDLKLMLDWDSTYPLSYQVSVHQKDISSNNIQPTTFCDEDKCNAITDSLKASDKIDSAYLIITFDLPQFMDKISHRITGSITFQQDCNEKYLTFPPLEVSSLDATNHRLVDFPLSEDGRKDILTIIAASVRTDLVMIYHGGGGSSIDSTFEIPCSLLKIEVPLGCKHFFVVRRLSSVFDNSLIEVHALRKEDSDTFSLAIYTRSQDCVFPLLHHLYSNIPGVLIIPKKLYENYIHQHCGYLNTCGERRNLEKFNECVAGEIKHVRKFLQEYQQARSEDIVKFRSDLADLEKATDLYYLRLCKICENV